MVDERVLIRRRYFELSQDIVYHARHPVADWCFYLDAEGNRATSWHENVVRWEIRTRCGLLVDGWTRERDDNRSWTSFEEELASRIARPCRRCFDVS